MSYLFSLHNSILFFTISSIILFSSCGSQGEWGLKNILFKYQLEFTDKEYTKEIIYDSNISSGRFEIRLFFPQLQLHPIQSEKERKQIRELLNGFEYKFYKMQNNTVLAEYSFDINDKKTRYQFNDNKPPSLWLESSIRIERGHIYKILLKFPATIIEDERFTRPFLVGGISKNIIL